MALKNRSMYAILGILSLSPNTGYGIKKYCDTILKNFWNENFGHIYPTLKRLTEDGFVEIAEASDNNNRITYSITESGLCEFERWLRENSIPQPIRSEFMLKLFFSSSLTQDEIVKKLTAYKAQQIEKHSLYLAMQERLSGDTQKLGEQRAFFIKSVLRSGILAMEAAIRWCEETIEEIKNIGNRI